MTPLPADEPNLLPNGLNRLEDEPMADWVARLREDMQARARSGPVPRAEEYLRWFPALADDRESILDLVAMERLLRRKSGDDTPTGFFFERFPDLREALETSARFRSRNRQAPRRGRTARRGRPRRVRTGGLGVGLARAAGTAAAAGPVPSDPDARPGGLRRGVALPRRETRPARGHQGDAQGTRR